MRTATYCWVLSVVSGMVLGGVAGAQSSEPACTVGVTAFSGYSVAGIGGSPYTATAKTSFEQRLLDGSYIRGYAVTHQARDGAGRTMTEFAQGCRRDENGVPQPQLGVNVFDPVAKVNLNWQVNAPFTEKVVHVFHQSPTPPKALTREELAARSKTSHAQQPQPNEYKREDLGTRTIAGMEAHGTRMIRTIPPGEEGNELPLVTIHEQWQAKDHVTVLMAIDEDPRRGRTTYEVEELTAGEPDASVFAPPEGYKLVELNPPTNGVTRP